MISATVNEGHVAVWAGCNAADNVSWVQGGIAAFPGGGRPVAYIERHQYGASPAIQTWPLPLGATVVVKLVRTSYKHWKVVISFGKETHEVKPVYIPKGLTIDACLEIWGKGSAVVQIGSSTVKGSAND